ncbi:PH domain-containing protein [Allorhodopirellula heiligendammensis]|uniref:Uncharacterized protein YyaB-like PH domain-containing protein n=1 Tax=Allorhodopirellula heiligendammensis TaxID=2714739 RepID=A0A5C6BFB3_9BACT|nr:PH domain-containing protein [Allorhodopirellula heiligendammensis]TWU10590.1 hypothetical protein Poly21_44950 [Allorhodopirellula heiligendammensis]
MTEPTSSPPVERSVRSQSVESDRQPSVYRSAIDWWVGLLLVLPILFAVVLGIVLIFNDRAADASSMFLTAAAILIVTAIFAAPCRYTFLTDALSIRCGVICYQIPYDAIQGVNRSSTLRSGPALSLRRVAIQTDRREYIISPVHRERFINELKSRLPA